MTWTDPVVRELCRYHAEADPERLVTNLCERLLTEYPTERGRSPLEVLGSVRGVRDYHREPIDPAAGCSGLLIPRDGGYEITVHSDEPEGRQNFSIAHEIVHTFFRDICPTTTASPEEERLCDLGAAVLTMPAARFAVFLGTRPLCFATVEECRREFAVSFIAAARRAVSMTGVSACLFVANMARTKKQIEFGTGAPILRITKWWASPRWPFCDSHLNLRVIQGSVIGDAFVHQDERAGRGSLGVAFRAGAYDVEARGYGYLLPTDAEHRQVLALARGPLNEPD